jgi:phosphopantothenoylcysteine decarboxylase/phosphopantothenate--cysteine ligase
MTGNDFGVGRYPEISKIIEQITKSMNLQSDLKGYKILVTAGGTREPIDPIRFIGNRSSGKQGFALAAAAASRGAEVHLIAANTDLPIIEGITTTYVETAQQMAAIVASEFLHADALIMAAAVADARIKDYSDFKIHKDKLDAIELVENPDILKDLSTMKNARQVIIGFAAETARSTEELIHSGAKKLQSKALDLIYVNDVSNNAIFGTELTQGYLINKSEETIKVPQISKETLAEILLDKLSYKLESING